MNLGLFQRQIAMQKNSEHSIDGWMFLNLNQTLETQWFQSMKYFIPSVYRFFEGYMRVTSKAKEKTKVQQIAKFFSSHKTFHIWEL